MVSTGVAGVNVVETVVALPVGGVTDVVLVLVVVEQNSEQQTLIS